MQPYSSSVVEIVSNPLHSTFTSCGERCESTHISSSSILPLISFLFPLGGFSSDGRVPLLLRERKKKEEHCRFYLSFHRMKHLTVSSMLSSPINTYQSLFFSLLFRSKPLFFFYSAPLPYSLIILLSFFFFSF